MRPWDTNPPEHGYLGSVETSRTKRSSDNADSTPDREAISPTGILAAVVKVVQEQQRMLAALQAHLSST